MGTRYTVGGYWLSRKDRAEDCTARLERFMTDLAECDDALASWCETGYSRDEALKRKVDWRKPGVLLDLVRDGANQSRFGNKVIPHPGFDVHLWNGGQPGSEVGMSVSCGMYKPPPGLCNSAYLKMPADLSRLSHPHSVKNALLAVAKAWEPTWAGVFSVDVMMSRNRTASTPFADWMLYLSNPPRKIGPLPDSVVVEETDNGGLLVVLSEGPPQYDDREYIEKVDLVERALGISE